jgi:aerobic carbon-monoxide dehydrogenase medium subunit
VTVADRQTPEVVRPGSLDECIAAFADGSDVTVLGGGTILVPEVVHRRVRPRRVLMLPPDLARITREGGTVRIGAGVRVSELEDGHEPLATAARHLADLEVRSQATVGGNICAAAGETPRGDLQAPLIVLGARARSAGAGGTEEEPLEDFLARGPAGRLLLEVSYDDAPRATAYAAVWRSHAHHYTILAVAAARRDGELRVAATGVAPTAVRLTAVEASGSAGDAIADLDPPDDPLASAWYRRTVLPKLVEQALSSLSLEGS